MPQNQIDLQDEPFPFEPLDEFEAREFGKSLARSFRNIHTPDCQRIPEVDEWVDSFGSAIGEDIYREGAAWTWREFTSRFRKMADAL